MRRRALLAVVAVSLAAWAVPPATARADIPLVDKCLPENEPITGGALSTPNVEYLGSVPGEAGGLDPGGRLVGHYFYVTGSSHFSIYDVSDPVHPKLMSRVDFACRFENEDVAVNGDILIYSDFATTGDLYIYDVRDKRAPKLIADVPGAGTHTMECLDDCRYGFGSYHAVTTSGPLRTGEVVDLADPAHPKVLGDWTDSGVLPSRNNHDATEVSPGLVLDAAAPIEFLDTRRDVLHPTVLARSDTDPSKRYHTVIWPRGGQDRFILASFETNGTPNCKLGSGDFSVFDTTDWRTTGRFKLVSSYFLTNGLEFNGNPPANTLGCSPHWFNVRPSWHDGGVVALGSYDNGTRFLRVDPSGKVNEIGYFLPQGTEASAAYWITCDIVYVVDYSRGIDILRFHDAASACPASQGPGAQQPSVLELGGHRCVSRRRFRIRLHLPRGVRARSVRSASVRIGHRHAAVFRGRRLHAIVDLRGLPRGRFTVHIRVRLRDGRVLHGTRRYRTCARKRRGHRPRL